MKIGMIGLGFVGSTTAKVFETKHEVIYYDKFKEPYTNPDRLKETEVVFICVPTPMKKTGEIDYSSIKDSLNTLMKIYENSEKPLVVIRSTVVPGTLNKLQEEYPFDFASNPEFLREKNALEDLMNTNRIVIGADRPENSEKLAEVYRPLFSEKKAEYVFTDSKTAEMIKYAANVTLTGQIAIANEIYQISNSLNIDYNQVKEALLLDPRIGKNIDVPGPDRDLGFGGKCFPKDLKALIHLAKEKNYEPGLLEEIWKLNEKVRKNKDWENIPGATSENNFN